MVMALSIVHSNHSFNFEYKFDELKSKYIYLFTNRLNAMPYNDVVYDKECFGCFKAFLSISITWKWHCIHKYFHPVKENIQEIFFANHKKKQNRNVWNECWNSAKFHFIFPPFSRLRNYLYWSMKFRSCILYVFVCICAAFQTLIFFLKKIYKKYLDWILSSHIFRRRKCLANRKKNVASSNSKNCNMMTVVHLSRNVSK